MERNQGPQTPYEVYCYDCQTSFAVGTRQCVHCGRRIGGGFRMGPSGGPGPVGHPEEAEEEGGESLARRLASMGVWVVIVLGATLARLCDGGGQ